MMSMYSLYRAWLLRDTATIASPSLSLPPDLILTIPSPGPTPYQFIAHRTLVSSHSGYLKSAITQEERYGKTRPVATLSQLPPLLSSSLNIGFSEQGSGFTPPHGVLEVTLPTPIQADTFSPLLTFMYTGYLDLNLQNIYELLLAVNILQMPHALDLCRSYLVHNVHSVASLTFNNANLAKPIPGRGMPPHMTEATPLVTIGTSNSNASKLSPHEQPCPRNPETTAYQPPPPLSVNKNSTKRIGKIRRRRHQTKSAQRPTSSHHSASAHDSDSSDDVTVVTTERASCKASLAESGGSKLFDIASCDGPVHFTRVLNENYGLYRNRPRSDEANTKVAEQPRSSEVEEESEAEINIDENSSDNSAADENEENIARHLETEQCFQINFRHQIERQNLGDEAAENLKSVETRGSVPPAGPGRSNHRRVIPRTVLKPVPASVASQREVRLLDMNVQYYPCKTCGAKFPSYYFVHKHRRRVHPEEEGGVQTHPPGPDPTEETDISTAN